MKRECNSRQIAVIRVMGKHTNYKIECEVNMSTLTWICNVNHAVSISDILTKAVIRGGGGPKHPQNIQLANMH